MSIIKRNNYSQHHAEASISMNDVLLVELEENPTTGYQWQLRGHKGFELAKSYEQHSNTPGRGIAAVFSLTPNKEFKNCTLQFEYRRPWEHEAEPEATYSLNVKAEKNE